MHELNKLVGSSLFIVVIANFLFPETFDMTDL